MKCTATAKTGQRCKAFALPDTDPPRCIYHLDEYTGKGGAERLEPNPIDQKRQVTILEREVRRLIHWPAKAKTLEFTRTLISLIELLRQVQGMEAGQKKDDPTWMKKFRQS